MTDGLCYVLLEFGFEFNDAVCIVEAIEKQRNIGQVLEEFAMQYAENDKLLSVPQSLIESSMNQ